MTGLMGPIKCSLKRKTRSSKLLHQRIRKNTDAWLNGTKQGCGKTRTKSIPSRWGDIIKTRAKINELETNKTAVQRSDESKRGSLEKTRKHGTPLAQKTKKKREMDWESEQSK